MKLVDYTLSGFTDLLASDAPAPGGGSAAALEGAIGIALTKMVGSLTVGKAKYEEHQAFVVQLIEEAEKIKNDFIDVIDRDTEAFNGVSAVFSMPKETDADKAKRKEAMQTALKACTKTPYEMMCFAQAAIELTAKAVDKTNTNAASDLGVAALSLKAAVQGAWLNILINISGIQDQAFVEEYRKNGEAILAKALPMADQIYETVLKSL
ncbi:cyclodeaminase/cyclohydrolase family protein [Neisseria sp. Ec49-e6-T10]|uniref:cyclodeaminase/cyclohydrolase family protein n=1 Tax=Neisseria sp. Ec49-e6-T10 TaxID=3140744 RepID=UPI003EBBB4DC